MDFEPGSLYLTDDFSAYKCVDIDPQNVATLVPLQSRNAGAIRISKELSFAWLGPFIADLDGFGFDSIVRDYYSGTNYVVLNDLIEVVSGFKMTLIRSLHDLSLIALSEPQNLLLNVDGAVVLPWPEWLAQQTVPSDDVENPNSMAGLMLGKRKTDARTAKDARRNLKGARGALVSTKKP